MDDESTRLMFDSILLDEKKKNRNTIDSNLQRKSAQTSFISVVRTITYLENGLIHLF
jgi:hypothetical protein